MLVKNNTLNGSGYIMGSVDVTLLVATNNSKERLVPRYSDKTEEWRDVLEGLKPGLDLWMRKELIVLIHLLIIENYINQLKILIL